MSQPQIVLCFPVVAEHVSQISAVAEQGGYKIVVSNQQDIAKDIFDADIFCGHAKADPIDWPAVVEKGRLKWIQSSAAGLDHCLAPSVINSDIVVSGCSGLFADQVAEQTMALLFGLLRSLPTFFRAQQTKEYVRRQTDEIAGKKIGIAGFGGNGQRIAQVLRPFVNSIRATDLFHDQFDEEWVNVLPANDLVEMCRQSDILISTLPLTEISLRIIGDECFSAMAAGSYFVNVGRGDTVDQDSLIRNLEREHLAGAGLDVVSPEPLPAENPLWGMKNVIITPHVGAQSEFRIPKTVDLFCENIGRYLSGETLLNLVDKSIGLPRPEHRLKIAGF